VRTVYRWVLVILLLALIGLPTVAGAGSQPAPGGRTPGSTTTSASGY
jgi:hypothetical protein